MDSADDLPWHQPRLAAPGKVDRFVDELKPEYGKPGQDVAKRAAGQFRCRDLDGEGGVDMECVLVEQHAGKFELEASPFHLRSPFLRRMRGLRMSTGV
ncbi:MAG: hypothetical protein M3R03_05410 [Pseudomonadota bacterium]|nr:hypothetical protein [Pseudomonadota bacterium]